MRPGDRSLARPGAARRSARLSGVVALNGKIHAIGGRDPERNTVASHEIYDPSTNSWTMAAPLPLARDHLGAVVAGGRIHVFGGRTNATVDNTARHDVYDPATNSWSSAAPLLTAQRGRRIFLAGRIVYAGGECKDPQGSVTFTEVEAADENRPVDSLAAAAAGSARCRRYGRRTTGMSLGATWAAVTGRRRTC